MSMHSGFVNSRAKNTNWYTNWYTTISVQDYLCDYFTRHKQVFTFLNVSEFLYAVFFFLSYIEYNFHLFSLFQMKMIELFFITLDKIFVQPKFLRFVHEMGAISNVPTFGFTELDVQKWPSPGWGNESKRVLQRESSRELAREEPGLIQRCRQPYGRANAWCHGA